MKTASMEKDRCQLPRFFYWGALALIFVTPSQLAYALDPKHGPFVAYADILAVVLGMAFGLWLLFGKEAPGTSGGLGARLRRLHWAPLPVWAWIIVAVLSGFGAESVKAALVEIIQLLLYFVVVYMLYTNMLRTEGERRAAVRTLLVATVLCILFGLYQYVRTTLAGTPDTAALQEVKSLFQSRLAYSGFLTLVLPLFLGLALFSDSLWERYGSWIVIGLGGLTMLGPPLVWIAALVFVVVAVGQMQKWRGLWITGVIAAFLLITCTALPLNRRAWAELRNPYEEGPIYKVMQGEGALETPGPIVKKRWIEYMPALNMLADNFVLGVGAGNYQLNIGQPQYYGFLPNVKKSEADTNSLYIVTASSMGLSGLWALLAFMGYYGWRIRGLQGQMKKPFDQALACGLWGACLALAGANLFTSFFVRGTALAWALIYALAQSLWSERAQERGERTQEAL